MSLKAVNNQEPVTALRFLKSNYVLAGVGSFLKVYSWRKGELLNKYQVFPINKVHGIKLFNNDENAIVWGGQNIAVVSSVLQLTIDDIYTCKDRVVDAAILNDSILYVLTAHNEVLELELSSMKLIQSHKCSERSILYSGSLYITADKLYAAAGTIFGGVVIWDLHDDKIYRTFEAHEGSIFDVSWSNDGNYIASCSDDRAIIVSSLIDGKPIAYGWGHISRIWKVKFISPDCILSASEDCSARVWKVNGSETLECVRIMTGHQGRSVWSLDFMSSESVVSTGGGDGKIMLWDLDEDKSSVDRWDINLTFGNQIRSCNISETSGVVVATCKDGNIFTKSYGSSNWEPTVSQLGPVPVVKTDTSGFYALSSDGSGVQLFDNGSIRAQFNVPCRVLDFFVISESKLIVVPTPPAESLLIVSINGSQSIDCKEVIQKPGMGVLTCAISIDDEYFCVGTRNGGLALYTTNSSEPNSSEPCCIKPVALGTRHDAITSIKVVKNGADKPYILVTSRSAEHGIFSFPDLTRMFSNKARKLGSIEGICQHKQGLIVWGFQKDLFIAWNATLDCEMVSFDCGGSHRAWNCSILPSGLSFSYVRNNELICKNIRTPSTKFEYPLLQQGTHGREIRGMEVCPTNPALLATASEDTTVNLGWINAEKDGVINACSVNNSHVSGIQCLKWGPDGHHLFTGAGNGELILWKVETRGQKAFLNELSRMPIKESKQKELRVMDISILEDMVAVVYSDSSFRIWNFKKCADENVKWYLLLEEKYKDRCLLNADLWKVNGELWFSTSSTDGHLLVYKILESPNKALALTAEQKLRTYIHQSSVRCSDLVFTEDGKIIHYSGGDDNSIAGIELMISNDCVTANQLFMIPDAHSSAVTGIRALKDRLVTTGSDQKVRLWSLDGNLLTSVFTDVSDTGVLTMSETCLITGGIGLGFFHMAS